MPIGEIRWLASWACAGGHYRGGNQVRRQVCGQGKELGTLEPGKFADVIVVSGNLLASIEAM